MKKIFKHKTFNILKIRTIEGIVFRGLLRLVFVILLWFKYIRNPNGSTLVVAICISLYTLFTIDDYLEYKKTKIASKLV